MRLVMGANIEHRSLGETSSSSQVRATVTLHTGPLTPQLQAWLNSRQARNVTITGIDDHGKPVVRYRLVKAAIRNIKQADSVGRKAAGNEPQLEEMTLVCERIQRLE